MHARLRLFVCGVTLALPMTNSANGQDDRYERFANQIFERYDTNKDGRLSANELPKSLREQFSLPDKPVSREDFTKVFGEAIAQRAVDSGRGVPNGGGSRGPAPGGPQSPAASRATPRAGPPPPGHRPRLG